MNGKHYIGRQVSSFQLYDKTGPVTGVALVVDDEHEYLSGDQTGYVLEVPCSYGTQDMANAILAKARGKTYQGYTATNAKLDPLAELGDGVTVDGVYSVLASREVTFGGGHSSDISAPGEKIIRHRYAKEGTASSSIARKTKRQIADTRATITKTADEIRLEVAQAYATQEVLASVSVTADKISWLVKSGTSASNFEMTDRAIQLVADTIDLSGFVTFTNLSTAGQTIIDGGNIKAKTITAGKIDITDLSAFGATIGGWRIDENGIIYTTADNLNEVAIRPPKNSPYNDVFYVASRYSLEEAWSYPFTVNGNGTCSATDFTIGGTSIFYGALSGATGSISDVGGSFIGTHSYGNLSGTGGSYYGGHYNNVVNSCNLDGTGLSTGNGDAYIITNGANNIGMHGAGYATMWAGNGGGRVTAYGSFVRITGNAEITGTLSVTGSKSRAVNTQNYGQRSLSAFETPLPTFSDYGIARLDETGTCHICIDPIFAETVNRDYLPTVFLTPYGDGELYLAELTHDMATIKGKPSMEFSWETRYAQADAYVQRLSLIGFDQPNKDGHDYASEAQVVYEQSNPNMAISSLDYLNSIESSAIDYGAEGVDYYRRYERSHA